MFSALVALLALLCVHACVGLLSSAARPAVAPISKISRSLLLAPAAGAAAPPPLRAAGSDEDGDDDASTGSTLRGFERREIRALANRLKFENKLQCTSLNVRDISDSARRNIESLLLSDELLQVKLNVDKKKEAKEVGVGLARSTGSELVQTIGHSILLYRPGTRSIVRALLNEQQQRAAAAVGEAKKK